MSKIAKPAAEYDPKQDVARVKMGSGDLGHKLSSPRIALLHIAPTQCNIRLYEGSTMAWGEIHQRQ